MQVSVSVYSGYDPTDDVSPNHDAGADETLQFESPDFQSQSNHSPSPNELAHHSNAKLEPSPSPLFKQSRADTGLEATDGTPQPSSSGGLQPSHEQSPAQGEGEVTAVLPAESAGGRAASEGGLPVLPKLALVHSAHRGDAKNQKKHRRNTSGGNSDYVSSTDSMRLVLGSRVGEPPVVRFGNLLDHCHSEGSDAEGSKMTKPTVVKPTGVRAKTSCHAFDKKGDQTGTGIVFMYVQVVTV